MKTIQVYVACKFLHCNQRVVVASLPAEEERLPHNNSCRNPGEATWMFGHAGRDR
jgi:hypothetical protein